MPLCEICGNEHERRMMNRPGHPFSKYCSTECYEKSSEGRERNEKYRKSVKGKKAYAKARKKYYDKNKEKCDSLAYVYNKSMGNSSWYQDPHNKITRDYKKKFGEKYGKKKVE